MLRAASLLALSFGVFAAETTQVHLSKWVNSSEGIHAFLTFNSAMDESATRTWASKFDYVWGASADSIPWWSSANAASIISYYMPYTRDPTGEHNISWWQLNYPALVLYKCDRVTPAYECYAGEPCPDGNHPDVPLDIGNPDTVAVQVKLGVAPAAAAGYTALALDNFALDNDWKACGSFSGPGGAWVQRYTGAHTDPAYTADVLKWTAAIVNASHELGMLVIPNYQEDDLSPRGVAVAALTDGILDEGGFLSWGPGNNWNWTDPAAMNAAEFATKLAWVRHLQTTGKGYYPISEWGPGKDYDENPSQYPYNITGDANRWVRQYTIAAYLLGKGDASGIYLVCIQCYGNVSYWPEYTAPVGHALSEPLLDASSGIWARNYSAALVLLNPAVSGSPPQSYALPAGYAYTDLWGGSVPAGPLAINATRGAVLLRRPLA